MQVLPLHIYTFSRFGPGWESRLIHASAAPAAITWVTNIVSYHPIMLPWSYPVRRVFWINGSTISSTNVDMGIYTRGGVKLFSTGSTAMVGASSIQYAALGTDIVLPPGGYYLAWTCDNTTNRGFACSGSAANGEMLGMLQETKAIPLPATMTPVAWAQAWGPSACGITRTSTGF